MPKPTFQNRTNFKKYIRYFKNKFNLPVQKVPYFYIEDMLTYEAPGISTSRDVNVVIFDIGDTVDIQTETENNELIYIPALPGDDLNLLINSTNHSFRFIDEDGGLIYKNNFYDLYDSIEIGNKIFTIKGLGGVLFEITNGTQFTVTPSTTFVDEGESVTFTILAENLTSDFDFYYTVTGTVSSNDFVDNTLSGSITLTDSGNGTFTGTITKTVSLDLLDEISETFALQIRIDSLNGEIVAVSPIITVANITPIFSVAPSVSLISEGESVTFNITAENIPSGTTLYYNLSGNVNINDFSDKLLSGSFVVSGIGTNVLTGSITKTTVLDAAVESNEEFVFNLRTGSTSGPIVLTSSPVTIIDVPFTVTVGLSTTIISESNLNTPSILTVDIEAIGIPDGTVLNYGVNSIFGNVNTQDISPSSSNFTIVDEKASFNIQILRDGRTEGPEIFNIRIINSNGNIVATSENITILDTSFIGSNKTGKTFGPIKVKRDSGNPDNISDWYTICGLDKLPDGSKVSLFIDNSGSMTLTTVQASYNQLLQRLAERNMDVIIVTNPNEDWITPFDVELND